MHLQTLADLTLASAVLFVGATTATKLLLKGKISLFLQILQILASIFM